MNIQETKYILSHENDKDPLLEHSSYGKFIILDLRKIPYLQMNDECGLFGHAEDKNITDRNQFSLWLKEHWALRQLPFDA